tara:strand:- start:547 stop:723 length:177 start_codon:yes stop_codon:yes gene_type:complete
MISTLFKRIYDIIIEYYLTIKAAGIKTLKYKTKGILVIFHKDTGVKIELLFPKSVEHL